VYCRSRTSRGLSRKRCNWLISNYFRPADSRPSNVISKAFSAAFHRLDQRWRAVPLGSRLMMARYTHFKAAASVGKCPRALTALRIRALTLSMALVV